MKINNKTFSLCCISNQVHSLGFKNQTVRKCTFESMSENDAFDMIADKTINNIDVLIETLQHCAENGWNMRIGSDIFPLYTLVASDSHAYFSNFSVDRIELFLRKIAKAAKIIKEKNIRCSMHPDQFVVPASANPKTVEESIKSLNYHATVMDMLELKRSYHNPINIHMNCYKGGNISEIASRFIKVYDKLESNVRDRLVIENEHNPNSWSVSELIEHVFTRTGIPITYDSLHQRLNSKNMRPDDAYNSAKVSWGDVIPIFHFSDSDPNNTNKKAHADLPTTLHPELFENKDELVLDVEFKAKDYAILKIQDMYKHYEHHTF